jgi:hypothetical protein
MDRRKLLSGAAALAAYASVPRAWGDAIPPPGITGAQVRNMAPRRTLLTKTLGSGLAPMTSTFVAGAFDAFLTIVPIESPCYAARLGYANHANYAMNIAKAGVYPSDSYSSLLAGGGILDSTGAIQRTPVPTGGATGSHMTFDSAGVFNTTVNTAGATRNITLPAVAGNTGNTPAAFSMVWSDLVPCVSIPRADGGTQHLLFVYTDVATGGLTHVNLLNAAVYNNDPLANQGRLIWNGIAWVNNTSFADNPTGTGWKFSSTPPLVAIQYLTANAGIQTVVCGDSLSCAPPADQLSTPLLRAGYTLSTPTLPIEYASMSWGGTNAAVYEGMLSLNAAALRPSLIAYQPISRNDTYTIAGLEQLLAQSLGLKETYGVAYGSRAIWNIAGLEPTSDGNAPQIAAFTDMRARLLALGANSSTPVIDAASVIGNVAGGAPWDYLPGFTDADALHPNMAGSQAIMPQAVAALHQLIGR